MKESYDLTTINGMKAAINDLREVPIIRTVYAPYFWLADKAIDLLDSTKSLEKQIKAAKDLIRAGKENGVKKMKIIMDHQAGIQIDVPIKGVRINSNIGTKGKTTIEVEYF